MKSTPCESPRVVGVLLCLALTLTGCNCFRPTEDCQDVSCVFIDSGVAFTDGGPHENTGGSDAGHPLDAGQGEPVCALWSGDGGVGNCAQVTGYVATPTECEGACVMRPITTAGLYPSLASCVRCGCDTAKLTVVGGGIFGPSMYCDDLTIMTADPSRLEEAFPGFDAGCSGQPSQFECQVLRHAVLGDAGYDLACAASLVPKVTRVVCHLFL